MNNNIQTYPTCDHHRVLINFIAHLAEQTFTGRFHKNHYILKIEIEIIFTRYYFSILVWHLLYIPFFMQALNSVILSFCIKLQEHKNCNI